MTLPQNPPQGFFCSLAVCFAVSRLVRLVPQQIGLRKCGNRGKKRVHLLWKFAKWLPNTPLRSKFDHYKVNSTLDPMCMPVEKPPKQVD
jgi:hypothetical protein